jgi:hypothetical protein
MGYAWSDNSQIIFGRRKVNTVENILSSRDSFTNKMGITFRLRHYVSSVEHIEFYSLQQNNGKLVSDPAFSQNVDRNVNFFNIDMVYTWQFAQGSFLNVVWKDAGFIYHDVVERNYFKNFGNTIDSEQNNNISLKVIYFLDYLDLKKGKKKAKS